MQYTESMVNCRKGKDEEQLRPEDWQTMLEPVKDPRRKQGQRYSLHSILLLALAAILSNHVSELAIAQWGAAQSEEVKKALGFENGRFTQYRRQFASPSGIFHYCGSHALQLYSS